MSVQNRRMFSVISGNYDLMNRVMSLGLDGVWRRMAASKVVIDRKRYAVLDVAAGTGDLSIAIDRACSSGGKRADITGVDFNRDMLDIAKCKARKLGLSIKFEEGDALALKFRSGSFEVVTSAFGLRNFDSVDRFAKEAFRVLKRGGKLVLLEMSKPEGGIMGSVFKLYSNLILIEGAIVNPKAYSYLVGSIKKFDRNKLLSILRDAGFSEITLTELPSRTAFLVTARKP